MPRYLNFSKYFLALILCMGVAPCLADAPESQNKPKSNNRAFRILPSPDFSAQINQVRLDDVLQAGNSSSTAGSQRPSRRNGYVRPGVSARIHRFRRRNSPLGRAPRRNQGTSDNNVMPFDFLSDIPRDDLAFYLAVARYLLQNFSF